MLLAVPEAGSGTPDSISAIVHKKGIVKSYTGRNRAKWTKVLSRPSAQEKME